MTACEQLRTDAPALAALGHRDPERLAAWAHAAGCPECARALREGERLQTLLGEWHPEPLSAVVLGRAAQTIELELRRDTRLRTAWPAGAAAAFMVALAAIARQREGSPIDWVTALALAALALVLSAMASRLPRFTIAAAAGSALHGALIAGGSGAFDGAAGLECLVWELGAAAVVLAAAWTALRGGSLTRAAAAATAAAGALAGDAALQVTCTAHEVGVHLLVFHLGGVLLAAAIAGAVWQPARRALAA